MDYEELVKEINNQGITKLPALLVVVVERCIHEKVFVEGGLERTVRKVIERKEEEDEQSRKETQESEGS